MVVGNGKYNVTICVGSDFTDAGPHYIEIEGQKLVDMQSTTRGQYYRGSLPVEITDGQLDMSVSGVAGCGTAYLNYIIVDPVK